VYVLAAPSSGRLDINPVCSIRWLFRRRLVL